MDNLSLKRREDWFLRETASDVVVQVEGVRFPLHKVLLVSRSGLLRRLVKEKEDEDSIELKLEHVPGGAFGFELAARFCYSVKVDLTAINVVLLLCVGEHLQMTEEFGTNNLLQMAQTFLEDVFQTDFKSTVRILHSCQTLLPLSESLQVVGRAIDSIVSLLSTSMARNALPSSTRSSIDTTSLYSADTSTELDTIGRSSCRSSSDFNCNSWLDDLSSLSINFYEKVIKSLSIKAHLPSQTIARSLIHYTHKCMERLAQQHSSKEVLQQEERRVIETIVKLLPSDRNAVAFSFLMELLRTALLLNLPKLRLDLERRIAPRLHQATLDDLLIPLYNHEEQLGGDGSNVSTIYDVEATRHLIAMFMQLHVDGELSPCSDVDEGIEGSRKISIAKVGYLVDSYLAEIAPDANLSPTKFASVAELFPKHARASDDSLYRAIDIYLKAHPTLKDEERKEVCKVVDFHKLSHDACAHAGQNERLPLPAVVQVLQLEQMRIRDEMNGGSEQGRALEFHPTAPPPLYIAPSNSHSHSNNSSSHGAGTLIVHPANGSSPSSLTTDPYASVRRENMELKLEVARMRMRLSDIEKEHTNIKQDIVKTHHVSPQHHHSTSHDGGQHHHHHGGGGFFHAVSKTLSKLNVFHHSSKQHQHHHEQEEHSDDHRGHRHHHHHHHHHHNRQSKSPDPHSHHHPRSHHSSNHHKSPSGHHRKSPVPTNSEHHSSNHSRRNGSRSTERHSSQSQHKSTSSERHRRGSRHRRHSPSPEHLRTHQTHKASEHDDHHRHRHHHHHHHHRSHHRHRSPSINSSRSPSPERHHHSHDHHRNPTPEHHHHKHHHHSPTPKHHHRSPTPERHHHSHHRSRTPEHHHHSHHRSPTPEHHHRSPTPERHHHSHHRSPTHERHHRSPTPERHHHSPSHEHRHHSHHRSTTPERHHHSHHHSPSQEHHHHRNHKTHNTHHQNSHSPDHHHHGKTHHTDSHGQDDRNHHRHRYHHRTHQHHHKHHNDGYYGEESDEQNSHKEGQHHNPHPPHHLELHLSSAHQYENQILDHYHSQQGGHHHGHHK